MKEKRKICSRYIFYYFLYYTKKFTWSLHFNIYSTKKFRIPIWLYLSLCLCTYKNIYLTVKQCELFCGWGLFHIMYIHIKGICCTKRLYPMVGCWRHVFSNQYKLSPTSIFLLAKKFYLNSPILVLTSPSCVTVD